MVSISVKKVVFVIGIPAQLLNSTAMRAAPVLLVLLPALPASVTPSAPHASPTTIFIRKLVSHYVPVGSSRILKAAHVVNAIPNVPPVSASTSASLVFPTTIFFPSTTNSNRSAWQTVPLDFTLTLNAATPASETAKAAMVHRNFSALLVTPTSCLTSRGVSTSAVITNTETNTEDAIGAIPVATNAMGPLPKTASLVDWATTFRIKFVIGMNVPVPPTLPTSMKGFV